MNIDSRKKELIVFFSVLAAIAIALGAGFYLYGSYVTSSEINAASSTVAAASQPAVPIPIPAVAITTSSLAEKLAPVQPIALPSSMFTFRNKDWLKAWGEVSAVDGVLYLRASSSSTGGDTFLIGSQRWTNYDFQANINWTSGTTFSVIAREKDTNNFTYCDFGIGEATIIEKVDGNDTVIGSHHSPNGAAGVSYNFGIRVFGNEVACTVDGNEVAAAVMQDAAPAAGGIGFVVWDSASSTAAVMIKDLNVSPLDVNNIIIPAPSLAPVPAQAPVSVSQAAPSKPAAPVALTLPYQESDFAGDVNWLSTWGTLAIDPSSHALIIAATSTTNGAVAVLQNSMAWTDYAFDATVNWERGEEFGLVARYSANNTYVECLFFEMAPDYLEIDLQQYINGSETTLAQGSVVNYDPRGSSVDVSMSVYATGGRCSIGGHVISNMPADSTVRAMNPPYSGGIGFALWDPSVDNSQVIISNVSVVSNH